MIVYLSGPITAKDGYTVEQNVESAAEVFYKLVRLLIPTFCVHFGALAESAFDIPYDEWMKYDYALIDASTHVLMLPRWETSSGARLEHDHALRHGKKVFYSLEELLS